MAKKAPKQQRVAAASPSEPERSESGWVASMHEYHGRTGLYRAEDLDRVLGDPRDQVSGQAGDTLACRISRSD
jgi:hypothetical protein